MRGSYFSPHEEKIIRNMWPDYSASEIAMKLKNRTRNAICGKAWRMGLPPKRTSKIIDISNRKSKYKTTFYQDFVGGK